MSENKKALKTFLIVFIVLVVGINMIRIVFKTGARKAGIIPPNKIALIYVNGAIFSSKNFIDLLNKYDNNNSVKCIVMRIDSPGGGVVPVQEIYRKMMDIRFHSKKKIYVSFGSLAASGGYYLACAADKIYTNPGTIIGSIGVIIESLNFEDLSNKIGIRSEVIKSGRYKDIGSSMRKMYPEERKLLQDVIDDVHDQFVDAVTAGRFNAMKIKYKNDRLTKKDAKERIMQIADGRIFSGRQAQDYALVDDFGTLADTIRAAGKENKLGENPEIVTEKKKNSIFDYLMKEQEPEDMFGSINYKGLKYLYRR
jgi:protease-4